MRSQYCSRCFGLFQLRYHELKASCAASDAPCYACYAGLAVAEDGSLVVEAEIVNSQPFSAFAEARAREVERQVFRTHHMTAFRTPHVSFTPCQMTRVHSISYGKIAYHLMKAESTDIIHRRYAGPIPSRRHLRQRLEGAAAGRRGVPPAHQHGAF